MRLHHLCRGLLHVFIFSYAPITRRCISLLVCRRIDFNEEDSVRLWVEDLAVECFERDHFRASVIGCCVLACFFSVSCFMVYKVYWSHGIQQHQSPSSPHQIFGLKKFERFAAKIGRRSCRARSKVPATTPVPTTGVVAFKSCTYPIFHITHRWAARRTRVHAPNTGK